MPGITPAGFRSRWHVAADLESADSATDLESEHRTDPLPGPVVYKHLEYWVSTNQLQCGFEPDLCVAPQYLSRFPQRVFDNTGNFYNVSNAVGSNTLFNQTLYENYSPA